MLKIHCKWHYKNLATYSCCTTWREHFTKTAPARRRHSVGGSGVSKMSAAAAAAHSSISAGAPPQTPLGELTAFPRPLCWISGVLLLRGGKSKERRENVRGEGGEERKGEEGLDPQRFTEMTPLHRKLRVWCVNVELQLDANCSSPQRIAPSFQPLASSQHCQANCNRISSLKGLWQR